jgi:hypothetical protein
MARWSTGTDAHPLPVGALPERVPRRKLLVAPLLFVTIGQVVADLSTPTADQDEVGSGAAEILVTLQRVADRAIVCGLSKQSARAAASSVACAAPCARNGSIACAASPSSVMRPLVHRSSGSRS